MPPTPQTPKPPEPDTIIELVETTNAAYVVLAFLLGAAIVVGAVWLLSRDREETPE